MMKKTMATMMARITIKRIMMAKTKVVILLKNIADER
jgi:hypothetical protein